MAETKKHKQRIGLVLSAVPGYSETFFRNKIKGLQEFGFEVLLFVDYLEAGDLEYPCEVVSAVNYSTNRFKSLINSFIAIIKSLFVHPKRSLKLYQLDKKDGLSFKDCIRNLIVNEYLLTHKLDWLHFGFGMFVFNRENIAQAIGAQMAVSFRGADLYLSPLKHPDCYKRLFLKEVQYHVLSQEMKQDLIAFNIMADAIKVIPPAINIDFFQPETKPIKNDQIKIVTVARLHWKKGLEYSLEAIAQLKQQGLNVHYTIIGDGDQLERLTFATYQLQIQDCVSFTGKMPQSEVKKQLTQADIYVQYSIQEGFCNALLEAQAMGLLSVVSDAEGLAENVLHGETGWVVPKRQPKVLSQKILEVLNLSLEEKQAISTTAMARVQQDFNLEKQQEAFLNFYGLHSQKEHSF